jgi:secreted trypsin-like serine protease
VNSRDDSPVLSVNDDPIYVENLAYFGMADPRVLGGVVTEDFPDCVAVGGESQWCCSGTLIASGAVLTAAHCVREGCNKQVFFGQDVAHPSKGRIVKVLRAVIHDGYGNGPFDDLAVLLLAKDIRDVRPRKIAPADLVMHDTVSVRIAGFGATVTSGLSGYGQRREADLAVAAADSRYGIRIGSEFVAGRPHLERDSCPGDSGGPAYTQLEDGAWVVVGATSRATPGASPSRPCGDGGIYTFVPAYRDWLDRVIA